jgi:membrane protease YdiL (CAAX protease family)
VSHEESERRADVLKDERSAPVQQHESAITGETHAANDVGRVNAPDSASHAVRAPTTITASASPEHQYVGQDVTITGRLTAVGTPVPEASVTLYNADDSTQRFPVAAALTDAAGYYQFTLAETAATAHVYMVCARGDGTYGSAQSTELLVAYSALPAEAPAVEARRALNLAWSELLPIFLILVGEGLFFAGYQVLGVSVQALNIAAIAVIVVAVHGERVQLVQALALISVFRVVNLSFVLIPTVTLYWVAIVYGVMYLPLIVVILHEKMNRYDLGIDGAQRSVLLLPLGVVAGTAFAVVEHAIVGNQALIPTASASELIQLSVVMIFFVALVEALLFLVLLQPQLVERSGAIAGILITSVIFGAMHAGYANVYELLFATGAGAILGTAFYKTRDLALVVTILAVNNIVLFGVLGFFR